MRKCSAYTLLIGVRGDVLAPCGAVAEQPRRKIPVTPMMGRTNRTGPAMGTPRVRVLRSLLGLCCLLGGCGEGARGDTGMPANDGGVGADPGEASVRLRFELPAQGSPDFGAIPWPSDLYVDEDGRIAVGELPGGDRSRQYLARLRAALSELDGFGATTPMYFYFDGELDRDSLPPVSDGLLADDAPFFLVDVDSNSPTPFERVAVQWHYHSQSQRLSLRPTRGTRLVPGRRYAAVVTSALQAADGTAVGPTADFAAIRALDLPAQTPRLRAAQLAYDPIFDALARAGTARRDVVGLAVFRVQSDRGTLDDAFALATDTAPEFVIDAPRRALDDLLGTPAESLAGLDVKGGVAHEGIGAMLQGRVTVPSFVTPQPGVHGRIQRDATGALLVKRFEEVPFTAWLPPVEVALDALPLVVFQHGLGGDRSQSAVLANRLCAAGHAVVAMDLPYHGSRSRYPDERNNFTGAPGADGFGDRSGDFAGLGDEQALAGQLHPGYYLGAVFQSMVDLGALLAVLRDGDLGVALAGTEYAELGFDPARIAFVGVGLGGELGLGLAARGDAPAFGALEALFSGGHVTDNWSDAPGYASLFSGLAEAFAVDVAAREAAQDPPQWWPELALYQTLIDLADPQVLAAGLRQRPVNVLLVRAQHDERRTGRSSEALARAVGAGLLGETPRFVPSLVTEPAADTVSGNYLAGDDTVTRVLVGAAGATHQAYYLRTGQRGYDVLDDGSYVALAAPEDNPEPIDALLEQTQGFLSTYATCQAMGAAAVCPASVSSLPGLR